MNELKLSRLRIIEMPDSLELLVFRRAHRDLARGGSAVFIDDRSPHVTFLLAAIPEGGRLSPDAFEQPRLWRLTALVFELLTFVATKG